MSLTFYVGEQPIDPLVITVTNQDGSVRDLTDVDSVEFVGDELPAGVASIANAPTGKVQYDFDAPFTTSEVLVLQIAMTESSEVGGTDYSKPFTITVYDPADTAALIVTPAQVELATGVPVSNADIARAQSLISLMTARNLGDADWYANLSSNDQFWLQTAVSYEAAAISVREAAGTVSVPYVPGATSVSNGDVSVSFSSGSGSALNMPVISSEASTALRRLTWMRPLRSVSAAPFLLGRGPAPSNWKHGYTVSM